LLTEQAHMPGDIEISVGDVNDVEARVFANYRTDDATHGDTARISGTLRGPYCETARTLPAEFAFRQTASGSTVTAEAYVADPCIWSPELPHVYQADIEVRQGGGVVAEYHGPIGFRKAASETSEAASRQARQ
jgi:beta-galactosidase/beta-glucuronidase